MVARTIVRMGNPPVSSARWDITVAVHAAIFGRSAERRKAGRIALCADPLGHSAICRSGSDARPGLTDDAWLTHPAGGFASRTGENRMSTILALLIAFAGLYLAYRIIRNGFARPQSEKLNACGIAVYVALFILAVSYVAPFVARYF